MKPSNFLKKGASEKKPKHVSGPAVLISQVRNAFDLATTRQGFHVEDTRASGSILSLKVTSPKPEAASRHPLLQCCPLAPPMCRFQHKTSIF